MWESVLQRASSFAGEIDFLILVIAVLTGIWLLLAEGVFFYFCFKYRKKSNPKALYVSGESKEEMKWIHLPHNLVLVCDIVIVALAVRVWYKVKQDQPPADEVVRIEALQWGWRFTHPGVDGRIDTDDDVQVVDELHVKEGLTYHFKLVSRDVQHSFSVPVFRLKQDAVPGREITGWFKPTKTGVFDIQCTEICGVGHALMPARIHVETPEEHTSWLQTQLAKS